ncbi:MAG TPA: hypothetical protein VGX22_12910 [Candidatus Dormibacteraeota bacterium]|nr:hypothetical protein [Candidatus Dormibacteraeota bacterium]
MRRSRRSRVGALAAVVAAAMTGLEITPPRGTIISTDVIPCMAVPDPVSTDYSAWTDTVWSDAPRLASQSDCI